MELEYSEKYEPLFQLLEGAHPKVDTVIITGGRNSAKSHAVGTFICVGVKDYNYRALYTRYTLTSVDDSIMPEFKEKIKLLNAESSFTVIESRNRINCNHNEGKIIFKGIKTAQGNQTASLKSLKDFSLFVAEEAEELPSFDDWDKVKKSIRVNDVRNLSILILNPTLKSHWIFKEFFESRSVNGGFNGVVGNVMYIHTSYLDVDKKHIPENLYDEFESKRKAYEEWSLLSKEDQEHSPLRRSALYYKHTLAGGWLEKSEGVIFDNWKIGHFVDTGFTAYGLDFGFDHPTALTKVSIDLNAKKIYVKEILHKRGVTEEDIILSIKTHCGNGRIVADSANPMIIEAYKRKGVNIHASVKGPGSVFAGITKMLDFDIIVDPDSKNLQREFNSYVWHDKKANVPLPINDDSIDSIRYCVSDMLKPKMSGWVV